MVVVLVLTLGTGQAQAQITFTLNIGNTGGAGSVTGPYGQVVVTNTGTNTVSLAVTAFNSPSLGTTNPAQFNDLSFDVSPLATGPSTQSVGGFTWTLGAGGTVSDFGKFDQNLDTGTNSQRVTTATFTLSGPSGFSASSFKGFAFHWYSNTGAGQNQVTGFATSVPEPGPLLGAGVVTLMGLGYTWRRRKRATA